MKKLILFLAIIVGFAAYSQAQTRDKSLTANKTYQLAGGVVTTDKIDASTSLTKVFEIKVSDLYQYTMAINLDKVSGTPDSVFVSEFVSLDGINYVSTAVAIDTIVTANADKYVILSTIADVGYRFYKYVVSSDVTNTMEMTVSLEMKIHKK